MREINFRAWSGSKKAMYRVLGYSDKEQCFFVQGKGRGKAPLADIVLMQYTGLKDKNGTKIYEGDLIRIDGKYKPGIYKVIWDDYRVAWWGQNIRLEFREREMEDDFFQLLGAWQGEISEVIGNVYENPEIEDMFNPDKQVSMHDLLFDGGLAI